MYKDIYFSVESEEWEEVNSEILRGSYLSEGEFEIIEIPLIVKGISLGDKVRVDNSTGESVFQEILERSQNSTYRAVEVEKAPGTCFANTILELQKNGCEIRDDKIGSLRVIGISVGPRVDIDLVYKVLERGELEEILGFEEASYRKD